MDAARHLGGITCLMRGNIGEVVAAPGGVSFILSFLDEVVSIVSAVGEAPTAAFLEGARKTLTTPGRRKARRCSAICSKAARSRPIKSSATCSRAVQKRVSQPRYS